MSKSLKLFKLNKKLKEKNNYLKSVEVKPLLNPQTLKEDTSTINFVKRVGGQMFQFYSLKDNLEVTCIPTYIASPNNTSKGKSPFYIRPTQQVIDGVTVPAGTYIDQSFIRKASIGTAHIQDAAIVDAKIFNLDASKITTGFISADRIEAGAIQSKHIGVNAIEPTNFSYSVYKQFNETFVSIKDAYADGKLTPIEKRSIKEQVEVIDMEFETVKDSMATFKVPHARVKYDALKTYLETLDLNSETITAIDRMVYEKSFADYYAELRSNQNNLFKEIKNLNGASIKAAKSANDLLTAWKTYGQDTLYIDDTRIAVKMIGAEQIAADSITADKIKFGSVTSKTLSEELRTDIGKGTSAYKTVADLAANLNDDNIITPTEKTFLFDKWQEIQKVSSWIDWQCTNIFKNSQDKETIYDPFYTAVKDFIAERVSKDGLNVANNIIDFAISWNGKVIVGSEAMRRVLLNYYEAENKMLGKLQQTQYNFTSNVNDKVTTASSVLENIANDNVITKQEKPALKLQSTNIINDYDDLILAANNQGLDSSNFTVAYTQLVNAFDSIFANMAVDTNWSGSDLRSKMKNYSDQRGIIVQTLSNDAKNKANEASAKALEALQALTKMADDNVITIYEKPALSFSWQNIINDYDELVAACVTQNVSSTEFKTAYTNLKQAVDLILANPKVDTEWDGADLRNRMKAYADARGVTVQRLSNDAKAKAEAAMAAITDAVSDRILTPSEKQQFKIKWVEEYQDFEKLKLKAQEAGINTSTGNYTGYVSAFNYINATFTPVWNSANNSQVDPTEWKTRFENLRKCKALLENEISAKIKDIASSALTATQQLTQTVGTKADSSALFTLDYDVKVIDGKVKAYGESITRLSADLSGKVGKGDVNSIISETQNGKKHIVSTEGLDNNLYYPVTIAVNGLFSKISMLISLGEAKASWATHGAGWSCGLTVTQRANGWGGNSPDLTIEKFDYAWTNQSPVINVGHLGTMSSALFYVRGGSKYHFYIDSNCYDPQLWTEKKIFNEKYNVYVEPISYSSGLEPKSLKQNVQANAVATSTLRANVDEINGKVVAQSSSILTLQTNVDTISRDLTTKANSSVLAQYYTRDEADRATAGKIENFNSSFEIGGRNYFRKTTPLNPHQLQEVRRDLPDTPNGFYVVGSQTPSNNLRLSGVITGNGKWTISGWVRGSQNTAISFFIDICDKELSKQIVINKDGTNSWEKFTYTITVDNYSSDTYNFVDISSLSWAYFFFKDIKIEKGSKATDWTPAPEDIDQKLTSIDASISTLQNTTATNTQSIATTQNQLNARFDALSIGGKNLFINSKQLIQVGGNRVNNVENGIFKTVSNGVEQYIDIGCYQPLTIGKYTISVQVRSSGLDKGVCLPYRDVSGWKSYEFYPIKDTGGTWVTVSKVIELSQEVPNFRLALDNYLNTAGTLDFKLPKVEKGILATDWTPAPEDIDQKFAETDANIKNTYITKSDATQAISSAKTELNSSYNKSLMDSRADGINLINFSKMVPGYFAGGGSIGQSDTDHMDMNYYSCIGDESFTCHMSAVTGSVGGSGRVLWYDSNKNLISSSDCNWNGTYAPYTFKSPVNARFYRYSMIGKYPAARIKLERGTTSTGFSFSDLDESFYRVLLIQALSGNQLLSNPDFRDNNSGVGIYDNAGTGRVILARVPKDPDNPSNSSHQLNCTISAGAVPGYGGFVFPVISKYNGLFAIRIVMKVPVGYVINIASNALPEGTDYRIIGSNEGTGKYETYTILCKCGTTGYQHDFGYVYFTDKSAVKLSGTQTDIVKISKLEAFDATSDKPMVSKANLDEYKQTVANQYGAISENINTISTKVNDNEAAIKVQAQSINGINAQYTIKTDVNGKVAGIGLVNSGKSSEFAVTADTFRVSNGSTDIAPFTISGNTVVFNGKVSFNNITNRAWKLTVVGTSYALPLDERNSITFIDNDNYSEDSGTVRGIRVTIYDKDKNVTFNNLYDTYTVSGCSQFKNDVFSLNLDRLIVTVRSMDATLANNQDFIDGMNKLGLDGNGINSSLKYNVRTSFCGISQYIASENSRNNIIVINGDEEGKQKKAIVTASIKDGKLIPESYSTNTGIHKLNEAADIAINNLGPSVNNLNKLVGSEDKVKGIVRNTTEINGGNIITGTITADKLEAGSITADRIQIGSLGKDNLTDDLKNTISTSASTSSQALASASTANNKIDSLEIGGVNVLTNSEEERTSLAATNKEYLMYEKSKVLKDFYDGNLGKPITISFEIKVPVAGAVLVYSSNNSAHYWSVDTPTLVANTWTKVAVTAVPQKHSSNSTLLESTLEFYGTYYTNRIPTVRRVKVESGNKATAWTASPAEINSAIASKSKTFITTPTVPYAVGDFWKDGNTVKVCTTARLTGAYTAADWTLSGDVTANNTSADTAKVNGIPAATVATNAQAGKTLSDNVMSDLVITPVEKSALLTEWNRIKAEYTSIVAQATALSVDKTALTTAYTALDTTSPKIAAEILANMTTNYVLTTATRDTFKAQLNTYFVQATTVTKAINDKISENAESKINNLVIGGTNLLLPAFDELTTPSVWFLPPIIQPNDIEDGATYTVSFEVVNTSTVTGMGLGFSDKHGSIPYGYFWLPDNSTGKKVWTGPLSSNCGRKFLEIYVNSTCIIKNIKLEKGDRSSGYTKISYYDTINSLILTYPNKRLQNKWSFIAFKKTAPSGNELVNYSHLKGKVVDQGYLDVSNTMFSNPKYDNTYILFRTTITTTVDKVLSIQNLLGDDAHSLAVNGQIYFYKQLCTTTSAVDVSLSAGVNVIDIMVSNGGGGAGFSLSTDLRSYGDMYATSLTSIELEDTSNTATSAKTKIDNLKVGSANLLKNSNQRLITNQYGIGHYALVTPLVKGRTYTLVVCTEQNSSSQPILPHINGSQQIGMIKPVVDGTITSLTFVFNLDSSSMVDFYNWNRWENSAGMSWAAIRWAVLVEGNASGLQAWTPSIYDINTDLNNIFSDNAITPDEKQSLLVVYKQISNDNDIWRNQAYLLGGNISDNNGVNHRRQHYATLTILSTNRPYLGWVCRSDALNQTDTLNAGERTTLMNAIAEYHAANQDLAQRVGSNLRTTGQTALSTANTANGTAAGARDLLNKWKANGNGTLYIDDNHIAVNKIGANEIAAGSITTEKLAVGSSTNLWANPEFKNYGANVKTMVNNGYINGIGGRNGWYFNGNAYGTDDTLIPVCGGEQYLFEYIIGYHAGTCIVGFHLYDHGKNYAGNCYDYPTNYIDLGNGWYKASTTVKIPNSITSAYLARVSFWAQNNSALTISDLIVTRKNSGQLIVDGTITGDKIKANTSISAPNIIGGSIKIGSISGSSDESGNTTDATRGTMFKVNADGGFRLVSRDSSGGIELSSYSRALTVWEGDVIRVKVGKLS